MSTMGLNPSLLHSYCISHVIIPPMGPSYSRSQKTSCGCYSHMFDSELMVDTRSNARGMFHLVDDILGLIVRGWGGSGMYKFMLIITLESLFTD